MFHAQASARAHLLRQQWASGHGPQWATLGPTAKPTGILGFTPKSSYLPASLPELHTHEESSCGKYHSTEDLSEWPDAVGMTVLFNELTARERESHRNQSTLSPSEAMYAPSERCCKVTGAEAAPLV